VSLTFHQASRLLRCHHCNFLRAAPSVCRDCGAPLVGYLGIGTERVETEVATRFPQARLLRMDRDTTTRKGSHARLLESFRNEQADILIGTQMIAKGLDFPRVTLVGVIIADTALSLPDFRAAERTFQLLAQVSGRAGRGGPAGKVLIQTYQPDHYAVVAAAGVDYESFWKKEARMRRQLPYPPYTHLVNIVSASPDEAQAQHKIREVGQALSQTLAERGGTQLIGPAPCPLAKLKDHYRWHLLLRDRSKPRLHRLLQDTFDQWPISQRAGLVVDVDPTSLM
jgi:primosomal protein N' (replication factor Y)